MYIYIYIYMSNFRLFWSFQDMLLWQNSTHFQALTQFYMVHIHATLEKHTIVCTYAYTHAHTHTHTQVLFTRRLEFLFWTLPWLAFYTINPQISFVTGAVGSFFFCSLLQYIPSILHQILWFTVFPKDLLCLGRTNILPYSSVRFGSAWAKNRAHC